MWCRGMSCHAPLIHEANMEYSVDGQRLPRAYHWSCPTWTSGWIINDQFNPKCHAVTKWYARRMGLPWDCRQSWCRYFYYVNFLQRGYKVIPFIEGYEDIAGRVLKLNHIQDHNLCPLNELLRDHFHQAVLKNVKGIAEPTWDYENAFGDGSMDLSRQDIWGSEVGKSLR